MYKTEEEAMSAHNEQKKSWYHRNKDKVLAKAKERYANKKLDIMEEKIQKSDITKKQLEKMQRELYKVQKLIDERMEQFDF
jgi:hypothetical protein